MSRHAVPARQFCPLPTCATPTSDGGPCDDHTWRLRRNLASLPDLLTELDVALARQTRNTPMTEKVKGKGETALSFNPRAADARTVLVDELVAWARLTGAPWTLYGTTAAQHLLERIPALRGRGDAGTLWDNLDQVFHSARQAIDSPAGTRFPIGPCPENCDGVVWAFIPVDDRPGQWACSVLPDVHRWSPVQWLRAGKRIRDLAERRAGQAVA